MTDQATVIRLLPEATDFRGAMFFETGAARYAWIAKHVIVCTGERQKAAVKLKFYKMP